MQISVENSLILVDGLLASDDDIVKTMLIDPFPSIRVIHGLEVKECCLHYLGYSLVTSFPVNISLEWVAKGFNSVFFGIRFNLVFDSYFWRYDDAI